MGRKWAANIAVEHAISSLKLHAASSWEMSVDLWRRLQFPNVVQTSLHRDIVLWFTKDHRIILVEVTVPWEEDCKEGHKRKAVKYQHPGQDCGDGLAGMGFPYGGRM